MVLPIFALDCLTNEVDRLKHSIKHRNTFPWDNVLSNTLDLKRFILRLGFAIINFKKFGAIFRDSSPAWN